MRTRSATPADAPFIRDLMQRLETQALPAWRDPAPLHAKLGEAKAGYDHAAPDGHVVLVCEDDAGDILGYAHAGMDADFFSAERQVHLYYLATAPGAEGRGIGRLLLNAIEVWGREQGATGVLLYVFAPNLRAREIYARAGFEDDMIKMVKPLA